MNTRAAVCASQTSTGSGRRPLLLRRRCWAAALHGRSGRCGSAQTLSSRPAACSTRCTPTKGSHCNRSVGRSFIHSFIHSFGRSVDKEERYFNTNAMLPVYRSTDFHALCPTPLESTVSATCPRCRVFWLAGLVACSCSCLCLPCAVGGRRPG